MLNISPESIKTQINEQETKSFKGMTKLRAAKSLMRWLLVFAALFLIIMFLPWTQNIRSKGMITTFNPEDRPQTINSTIAGRIEKWFVREGQLVKKGDTIAYLSEVKAEYFDPNLLERSDLQVKAKESAVLSYESKITQLDQQINALQENLRLKSEQLRNKVIQSRLKIQSDSIEYRAALADADIAQKQLIRAQEMVQNNLLSLVDFERRQLKVQETIAKKITCENKLLASRNELLNARIELNNVRNEYGEKIAKANSDKYSTNSDLFDAQGNVAKLQSQFAGYSVRSGFYYIIAPQDAYIVKVLVEGIGETVKEGEPIVSIMPEHAELAAEIYIRPMDLPLVDTGRTVRLLFDGWPALVFSGWQQASFGTFAGKIAAIDRQSTSAGKYRILVVPDPHETPWPKQLRVGSGASGIILLKDVAVWFELWRQFNGFPPEFYDDFESPSKSSKDKDKGDDAKSAPKEADEFKKKSPINKLK